MNLHLHNNLLFKSQQTYQMYLVQQFELLMKQNFFLHEKLMLHLFKKTTGKYQHKELLFLADCIDHYFDLHKNTPENKGKFLYWVGVPDAIIYDKLDHTYIAIQYKRAYKLSFEDFLQNNFVPTYNKTTHVMNILAANQEDFIIISNIMKEYKCEFDVRMQMLYNKYEGSDLTSLGKELDRLDTVFMADKGQYIINQFFEDFTNQNYDKYKYDQEFVQEFYKYVDSKQPAGFI